MEIVQRKRQVNTVNYPFSFIKHQRHFFQKLKKQNNTNILKVQCLLGGHGDCSMKLFSNHKHCYNSP